MKRIILFLVILIVGIKISVAQTPIQITGDDCNGIAHDLYAELDAGKAAVIFFFMDNCGVCPPPANAIQTMMNNITDVYPGMVTGYAFPYNDATTCTETINWCTNFGHLLAPYDSGAHQVAYYGGFGMPTVVLVGGSGANKRVLFSTLTFTYSDTITMRDSILSLLVTGMDGLTGHVSEFSVDPNPSADFIQIVVQQIKNPFDVMVYNSLGEEILKSKIFSTHTSIDIRSLAPGIYFVRREKSAERIVFIKT